MRDNSRWMIYGAYGFTGRKLAERAVDQGESPVLAGRNLKKLEALAERLQLDHRTFSLDDTPKLRNRLEGVDTVVHTAGPFVKTAEPMLEACVDTGTNYLDITGEIPVFEKHFEYNARAEQNNCAIIGGMGFDVVPTDCLAAYVAAEHGSPTTLDIVVKTDISPSSGTMKTMLELAPEGGFRRENNVLESAPVGEKTLTVTFPDGSGRAVSVPFGDLVTAWHSTGVPTITIYLTVPGFFAPFFQPLASVFKGMTRITPLRKTLQWLVERTVRGPDESQMENDSNNWFYARTGDESETVTEAWLKTPEAYRFTVLSCLEGVRQLAEEDLAGSYSPAQAFGDEFVLKIEGTKRYNRLP